jgi:hypothetical protein
VGFCGVDGGDDIQLTTHIMCVYSPREAAIAIVHLINSRNQNVALLALAVRSSIYTTRSMTQTRGMEGYAGDSS